MHQAVVATIHGLLRRYNVDIPTITAFFCCLAYVVVFSKLSLARHVCFLTQMNDLGNMTQAISRAAEGDLTMQVTNDSDGIKRSRFGIHSNFIFLLLAIPYRIFGMQPELLLILSSLACGVAGLGIFFFAKLHLKDAKQALIPAVAFWVHPMVHDANLYDFHVITIATVCITWMLWSFDSGHIRLGWILFILALLCKEDIPLLLFFVGAHYYWSMNRSKLGIQIMVMSFLYFLIVAIILIPFFQGEKEGSSVLLDRHGWLGGSIPEIIWTVLNHPVEILSHCLQPDHIQLPMYLLVSGGLFAFGAPLLLSVVLPTVFYALLAKNDWMTQLTGTYYWISSIAAILMACVLTTKKRTQYKQSKQLFPIVYPLLTSIILTVFFSPFPNSLSSKWNWPSKNVNQLDTLKEVQNMIPSNGSLSVQNNIGAHFANRPEIAAFPRGKDSADYLLFHLRYPKGPDKTHFRSSAPFYLYQMSASKLEEEIKTQLENGQFNMVLQKNGFYLFERRSALNQHDISTLYNEQFLNDVEIFQLEISDGTKYE